MGASGRMDLMEAIRQRRAVREYSDAPVERDTVMTLIRAAIQAPSATNAQPWAFAVIQDRALLQRCSDRAKAHLLRELPPGSPLLQYRDSLADPRFQIFHHAPTLIIICATPDTSQAAEDCCLAAQNLMLAAHALGLGTCPIGFARAWLNTPEAKGELGIPAECAPVFPVTLGHPSGSTPPHPRREPEIVCWRELAAAGGKGGKAG